MDRKTRVLEEVERRGEVFPMEDGFMYYGPKQGGGCLSASDLRIIADELDRQNEGWTAMIDEYFESVAAQLPIVFFPEGMVLVRQEELRVKQGVK